MAKHLSLGSKKQRLTLLGRVRDVTPDQPNTNSNTISVDIADKIEITGVPAARRLSKGMRVNVKCELAGIDVRRRRPR
jgi:hypothetical protein